MWQQIKKYILYAVIAGFVYCLLAFHYIYVGGKDVHILDSVKILKKERLNLRYTFYSLQEKKPETILKIDVLRDAGIGEILVEMGKVSEEQRAEIETKYGYE